MFKLKIEGQEITPTTMKNYKGICKGISIIEWLKLYDDNFAKAAVFFDYLTRS